MFTMTQLFHLLRCHLKELSKICTTNASFKSPDEQIYTQTYSVLMGCVSGITFANFHMGHLEKITIFKITKPRYNATMSMTSLSHSITKKESG